MQRAVLENGSSDIRGAQAGINPHDIGATGGSTVVNPYHEDLELKVFMNCTIHCIKFILSKKLNLPLTSLILSAENSNILPNHLELRHYFNAADQSNELNDQTKIPTLQHFLSKL